MTLTESGIRDYVTLRNRLRQLMLAELNDAQAEVVSHGTGPLLVFAGPGSGKTMVMTHRIAHLVLFGDGHEEVPPTAAQSDLDAMRAAIASAAQGRLRPDIAAPSLIGQGVRPDRILALTFTNKAARQFRERLDALLGTGGIKGMWVGTFHSVCSRILRVEAPAAGLTPGFSIADSADSAAVCRGIARQMDLPAKEFRVNDLVDRISRAKDELIGPSAFAGQNTDARGRRVAEVYRRYQQTLERSAIVDFGDLIMKVVRLFTDHPHILHKYADRFLHVVVDEYQDTNHAQYVLAGLLAGQRRNLVVVGDDDQSIYGWRGADVRNILDFERDFPNARTVKLEVNYRSTAPILDVANSVIAGNRGRQAKVMRSSRGDGEPVRLYVARDNTDEALFVVREVLDLTGREDRRLGDIAILFRSHVQSRALEDACIRASVPYQLVGGTRFYERREIKDLLAYLRVLANPADDVSLKRIANVPRRGIGDRTLEQWEQAAQAENTTMHGLLTRGGPPALAKKLAPLARLLTGLAPAATGAVSEALSAVLTETDFIRSLEADDEEEWRERQANVEELLALTAEFDRERPGEGLPGFLADVALVSEVDTHSDDSDALSLMTVHTAKGLEFGVVFLVGLDEGFFPHYRSVSDGDQLEEERRLCYVAMTRARDRLYLVRALERHHQGRRDECEESRFLSAIPQQLLIPAGSAGREPAPIQTRRPRRAPVAPVGSGDSGFSDGDRVEHPTFGVGTVVHGSGDGDDEMVTVAFPEGGLRKFLVKFARMRRL